MLENVTLPKSAFNLDEQVKHKLSFLENCFPPMCKFILVGHSIGAYMVLKLFEYLGKDQTRIMKGILLFPTIERMATSPSGRVATPILNYFSLPLIAATWWLSQLPVIVKKWLIGIWFGQRKVHKDCKEAILELVNANSIRNLLFLAADEMKNVDQTPAQVCCDSVLFCFSHVLCIIIFLMIQCNYKSQLKYLSYFHWMCAYLVLNCSS